MRCPSRATRHLVYRVARKPQHKCHVPFPHTRILLMARGEGMDHRYRVESITDERSATQTSVQARR